MKKKRFQKNPQAKEDFMKSAEKTESKPRKVYKPIEKLDLDIDESNENVDTEEKKY